METEIISCGGGFDFACLHKVLPTPWNTHTHRDTDTDTDMDTDMDTDTEIFA